MIFRASGSHLVKVRLFKRCGIYSLTPEVTPRSEISGKKYLDFVNSKISVIFGSLLGNRGHIVELHNGSIAYFIE